MDIVKKNFVSILCAVIVLVAIIAVFWPIGGYYDGLRTEVQQRSAVNQQLRSLMTRQRTLPVISLENPEPRPLQQFPTPQVITTGKAVMDAVGQQAQRVMDAAVEYNRRDLLVPGSLPRTPAAVGIDFRRRYTQLLTIGGPTHPNTLAGRTLRAGLPPTEQEIRNAIDTLTAQIRRDRLQIDTATGRAINEETVKAEIETAIARLPDQMRTDVGRRNLMYIQPDAWDVLTAITNATMAPDSRTVFWAQMGVWLQQDLAEAIARVNENSQNVLEAPIKHLIIVEVNEQFVRGGGDPQAGTTVAATGISPTGRVSNPLYDVMHFDVRMRVAGDKVPVVLQGLAKNRFVTVLNVNVTPVDSAQALSEGFMYGSEPVVELQLKLEQIFLRAWLEQYMPQVIKQELGIMAAPEGTGFGI
jgi:hypothetical protein